MTNWIMSSETINAKATMTGTPIDSYIEQQPEKFQNTLEQLRHLIKSIIPQAEEVISYQVGCFKHHYLLVGIGVTKDQCSLYTMNPGLVKSMQERLKSEKIKFNGSTLHFTPGEPLPLEIIKDIVKVRITENENRRQKKDNKVN